MIAFTCQRRRSSPRSAARTWLSRDKAVPLS